MLNTDPRPSLPLPPNDKSISAYVRSEWEEILKNWRKGWAQDVRLEQLQDYLEHERVRIFEKAETDGLYDWSADWFQAKYIDDVNTDFVKNRKTHVADVRAMWGSWVTRSYTAMNNLSLEALRSVILLNGAAIIAALTILSGQISKPTQSATIAARATIVFAVLSIVMMAAGHLLSYMRGVEVVSRVEGALLGNVKHDKVYAISRYLRRHLTPVMVVAHWLIYGSIVVFAIGATVSAFILATG